MSHVLKCFCCWSAVLSWCWILMNNVLLIGDISRDELWWQLNFYIQTMQISLLLVNIWLGLFFIKLPIIYSQMSDALGTFLPVPKGLISFFFFLNHTEQKISYNVKKKKKNCISFAFLNTLALATLLNCYSKTKCMWEETVLKAIQTIFIF